MKLLMSLPFAIFLAVCLGGCTDDEPEEVPPSQYIGEFESVDTTGVTSNGLSLALDAGGQPAIAFTWTPPHPDHTFPPGTIRFAHRQHGQWITENVSMVGENCRNPSLQFDHAGNPCITYQRTSESFRADLLFARREAGGWTQAIVDDNDWAGAYSSLKFASDGTAQVVYFTGYPVYDLRFAHYDGVAWRTELVDGAGLTGYEPSVILDASGQSTIAYTSVEPWQLRIAKGSAGTWAIETIAEEPVAASRASLQIDVNGNPLIAYRAGDPESNSVKLVRRDGIEWVSEVVGADGYGGGFATLLLGLDDQPRIVYTEAPSGWPQLGFRVAFPWDGEWQSIPVSAASGTSPTTEQCVFFNRDGNLAIAATTPDGRSLCFGVLTADQ